MAFRATFLAVVGVTLAGHVAALGFEMAVAARFGTGSEADALAFALMLAVTLTGELAGWVGTIVVPLYVEARTSSEGGAARFLRRAFAALALVTLVAGLLWVFAAPLVVGTLAPTLGGRGITVVRAFAPLLVLVPVGGLFAAALQAHGRFVAPGLRQLTWYGGALTGVLLFAGVFGAAAAPLGMVAGTGLFVALLAGPALRASGAPRDGTGPSLGDAARLLVPLAMLSACAVLNIAVERALAARLPQGSLAALTYAYRLLHFPLALFVVNATAMLLPTMAGHVARGEGDVAAALTGRALRMTVVFAMPIAALAIALAEPLTQVVLQRGAFTATSTDATTAAIVWYAPTVVTMAGAQVLYRAYQASRALWRMAASVGAGFALNLVLMPALTAAWGFSGLPVAASVSGVALAVFMLAGLRDRMPGLPRVLVSRAGAAIVVAGVACGVIAWVARDLAGGAPVARLALGAGAGIAAYAVALRVFAPAEARAALAILAPVWSGR
jgi:putative peptidoglycan lipid II flippase